MSMFRRRAFRKPASNCGPQRQTRLYPSFSRRLARWVLIAYTLSILGFVLFAILGGMVQGWQFSSEVEHREAIGDKVLAADFITTAPPDDQNAATYISQAIGERQLNQHEEWLIDDVGNYRLSEEAKSFVIQYYKAHPQIRTLLEKAKSCPQVDWHVKWRSPAILTLCPYLKGQREFALFLFAVGISQHETGDDAAAIQTAQDIFFLARAVDTRSTFVGHLVADGMERLGASLCLRLAESTTPPTVRQELYNIAQPMISDLSDDARFRRQFEAAIKLDRMDRLDSTIHITDSEFGLFCIQYLTYSAAHAVLKDYDGPIAAAAMPSWPIAAAQVPVEPPQAGLFSMGPALWRPFLVEYETTAERHAAAIAIACRLYADEHEGKWPGDLSALVPHYLPAIPYDPFDVHLRPMKYQPSDPPAIYSISMNGIDNHGDRTGAVSYKYGFSYDPWQSPDAVFPIGGVVEPAEKRSPEHGDE